MAKRSNPRKHAKPPAPRDIYNQGAESMLRCYNATEWRLEDCFSRNEEPQAPSKPTKTPPRK